jgi:hypothetical protein
MGVMDDDDVNDEVSMPDIDYAERHELMKHLDRREKMKEDLELE